VGYIGSMKIKTSITLSDNVLDAIDRNIGEHKNRSDFIEAAARRYLAQLAKDEKDRRDLEIINRRAEALNQEAEEVLEYQVAL
jgi:metal-responsive CopG/Arc/MetJ family transcriptional regulator